MSVQNATATLPSARKRRIFIIDLLTGFIAFSALISGCYRCCGHPLACTDVGSGRFNPLICKLIPGNDLAASGQVLLYATGGNKYGGCRVNTGKATQSGEPARCPKA
jgi:hypothetical protein